MRIAITRQVSSSIALCELTYLAREKIDADLARSQHREYERCLVRSGCEIRHLPPEPGLPDSVFVEDTAVVLDELAVVTRPGAESRRAETMTVALELEPYRKLAYIEAPGTLDGGDVLVVGRNVYVGLSPRTNESGFEQLRDILVPLGYSAVAAPIRGCLHLKSAVTQVAPDTLLINRQWVDDRIFPHMRFIDVDPTEPSAANALLIGDTVVFPATFRRTAGRLRRAGIKVAPVDVSELAKAEGGVTCCSLIFEV